MCAIYQMSTLFIEPSLQRAESVCKGRVYLIDYFFDDLSLLEPRYQQGLK